jgi:pimeloyl-ACP methyl ester carboxylesterase
MESADFRSICQETKQTILEKEQQLEYAMKVKSVSQRLRNKPSWVAVATKDRTINPDLERRYAARAKSHVIEVQGASHSIYKSRPKEEAALIEEAARHAQDQ